MQVSDTTASPTAEISSVANCGDPSPTAEISSVGARGGPEHSPGGGSRINVSNVNVSSGSRLNVGSGRDVEEQEDGASGAKR